MSSRRPTAPRAGTPGQARGRGRTTARTAAARAEAAPAAGAGRDEAGNPRGPRAGRALAWGRPGRRGEPRPTVSLRALILSLVALVAFAVLAPTLRYAVAQQEELRALNARVADAQVRKDELEHQLERWQDPAYVQAQARDRLGYVMPGETPYVVVDPETVTGGESPAEAEAAERAAAVASATPWYLRMWDSVQVAGYAGPGEEDPSGLTVPADPATP